jgi:hypothetical protein
MGCAGADRAGRPAACAAVGRGSGVRRTGAIGRARRLKRVFAIDIEKSERCGGPVKIIACIEDSEVIEKILQHLELGAAAHAEHLTRAGPEAQRLFD